MLVAISAFGQCKVPNLLSQYSVDQYWHKMKIQLFKYINLIFNKMIKRIGQDFVTITKFKQLIIFVLKYLHIVLKSRSLILNTIDAL